MDTELKTTSRKTEFQGILIDPGANYLNIIHIDQYRAYCREHDVPAEIREHSGKLISGIGGRQKCFGSATIAVPFPNIGITIDFEFQVTTAPSPTVLCLKDLKKTEFGLYIQNDLLFILGKSEKLELRNGLLYYTWNRNFVLFSEAELFKLHRSFGHPSASALYNVLKRARPGDVSSETRLAIEEMQKRCLTCARHSQKPRKSKLTIGTEDLNFNHTVAVDIMFINRKPILHVVDEATPFSAATWLKNSTSSEVWKGLLRCWTHVYLGPPDFLRIDQGSNFVSREFKGLADTSGITVLEAPIECPNSMSHVERYHRPLRKAYEKLKSELKGESDRDLLQLAVYAVNCTTGPEGLCPSLCVFDAIPRPMQTSMEANQLTRAKAIDL